MVDYKILIVEDEKQMATFLQMELKHEGYLVEVKYNGREGLDQIQNEEYDLVLLDLMLPGLSGMEICRQVRKFSDIPIIMLTAKADIIERVNGLDSGADDYLTKPFAIEELLARIRVIQRKSKENVSENIFKVYDLEMNKQNREVTRGGKCLELTKKEYDILEILLINKNIVLSRDQLISKIWGYEYFKDTNIVDVYIRYLRSKIDDQFEKKIITTVRGVGYIIKGENQ